MWHYADKDQAVGPVEDEEFQALAAQGVIGPETLVWREGWAEWQPYGRVAEGGEALSYCVECGRRFLSEDMVKYGHAYVCADCKNLFFQKIKEGVAPPGEVVYAGFWLRFGAKVIDWITVGVVQMVINIPLMLIMAAGSSSDSPVLPIVATVFMYVFQLVLTIAYPTFFIGRYGATLGKMACQIKVVTQDGGKVTYLRALGRAGAEMLSMLTLYIGYIIAAFDDEKRTLHDHICSTRVVFK